MIRFTLTSLRDEGARLWAGVGVVGAAFLLVLVLDAVFAGEAERIVAYPERARADVWVMQKGVENLHMASSLVARSLPDDVERVAGVAGATAILYQNAFVRAGGRDWFNYVVGLPDGAERGGPWRMAEGREHPRRGEAVLPQVIARQTGLGVGATIEISNRALTVVGLSRETYSMANSVTFVHAADLAEIAEAGSAVSYVLVEASAGTDASDLADRIRANVPDVSILTRAELVENDRVLALQMGTQVIRTMNGIGAGVAALVVAFVAYAAVLRRSAEFGVVKAIGAPNRFLYAGVLLQTGVLVALGLAVAALGVLTLGMVLPTFAPAISLHFTRAAAARVAIGALAAAVGAALVPARRIARLDPASAFRS